MRGSGLHPLVPSVVEVRCCGDFMKKQVGVVFSYYLKMVYILSKLWKKNLNVIFLIYKSKHWYKCLGSFCRNLYRFIYALMIIYLTLDINECEYDKGGCSHECVNDVGSFHCTCPHPLVLSDDKLNCRGGWLRAVVIMLPECSLWCQVFLWENFQFPLKGPFDGEQWVSVTW